MWIKFYNFNFGETSNAYIPTYKSFKSCQFSTFLNSVWKIFTAWKLLDLGMKGFCVGMKIKGGESLAGQMESLRRQHPNFTNLPKLVWNSPPFNLFSQINQRRPNSVQLYFYFDSKWMAPIEPIAKPIGFLQNSIEANIGFKAFSIFTIYCKKIPYNWLHFCSFLFCSRIISLLNIDYAENSFLFYDPARCYKNVPVVNSNFCHKVPHLCHNFH